MRVIFSLLGWSVLLGGIYTVANSLKVRIASEGIYTERFLFGVQIKKAFLASYQFDKFEYQKTSTEQSGSKHTEYFRVLAKSTNGEKVVVAEGLKGRGQAQTAVDKLTEQISFR